MTYITHFCYSCDKTVETISIDFSDNDRSQITFKDLLGHTTVIVYSDRVIEEFYNRVMQHEVI